MDKEAAWKEVKTKMWARVKEIEKRIPSYDYSEKHQIISTDEKFTKLVHDELGKSKKLLFNLLNSSYEQQKEGLTKDFEKIRDDLDIFMDEVKVKHIIWPERIPQEFLEKIVVHDSDMLREIPKLNEQLAEMEKHILSMEKPGTSLFDKEQLRILQAKASGIKKQADGLVRLFKEREMLINLRHIHNEREFEDIRREMETKI